jgi:sarcosine oxidase subunit beta
MAASRRVAYDAVVIGAGVIGSSVALELARGGRRALVVERNAGAGQGTTSYSSGIIRNYYSTLDACKLAWEAYQVWAHGFEEHIGGRGRPGDPDPLTFRENGGLLLRTPLSAYLLDQSEKHHRTLGIPVERWDRERVSSDAGWLTSRFGPPKRIDDPAFGQPDGAHTVDYAVYYPKTGYVNDPQHATTLINFGASRLGATFLFKHTVTAVRVRGGRVRGLTVQGPEGALEVEAPVVVNAAGPHSSLVNRLAFEANGVHNDSRISTRPMRAEVAYLPLDAARGSERGGVVMTSADADLGVYWRPEPGNKRILVGGLEPECDEPEFLADPDEVLQGRGPKAELSDFWTNLAYRAALRIPELVIPNTAAGIVSTYDVTEDWMPVYDQTALPGYYFAIGTSGNQFKNAPVAGKLVAQIIMQVENGKTDHDVNAVQLDLPLTGHTLDTAKFSRVRSVNATTASVMS